MIRIEHLFNPVQRQRLRAAIGNRASCRAYTEPPSAGDWASLAYAAGRYQLPGARLALVRVDESIFTGTLMGMGRITGCTTVAAVIASAEHPLSRVHAGLLGEAFVLEATAMGLGTCWVSGTYRKRMLDTPLRSHEAVLCIIAFGVPAPGAIPTVRRRKPIERICRGDFSLWSEELQQVALAIMAAPSAMNMQPWQLFQDGSCFYLDGSDRALLDAGIALCHAELALNTPHTWFFGSDKNQPLCWAQAKG